MNEVMKQLMVVLQALNNVDTHGEQSVVNLAVAIGRLKEAMRVLEELDQDGCKPSADLEAHAL